MFDVIVKYNSSYLFSIFCFAPRRQVDLNLSNCYRIQKVTYCSALLPLTRGLWLEAHGFTYPVVVQSYFTLRQLGVSQKYSNEHNSKSYCLLGEFWIGCSNSRTCRELSSNFTHFVACVSGVLLTRILTSDVTRLQACITDNISRRSVGIFSLVFNNSCPAVQFIFTNFAKQSSSWTHVNCPHFRNLLDLSIHKSK